MRTPLHRGAEYHPHRGVVQKHPISHPQSTPCALHPLYPPPYPIALPPMHPFMHCPAPVFRRGTPWGSRRGVITLVSNTPCWLISHGNACQGMGNHSAMCVAYRGYHAPSQPPMGVEKGRDNPSMRHIPVGDFSCLGMKNSMRNILYNHRFGEGCRCNPPHTPSDTPSDTPLCTPPNTPPYTPLEYAFLFVLGTTDFFGKNFHPPFQPPSQPPLSFLSTSGSGGLRPGFSAPPKPHVNCGLLRGHGGGREGGAQGAVRGACGGGSGAPNAPPDPLHTTTPAPLRRGGSDPLHTPPVSCPMGL